MFSQCGCCSVLSHGVALHPACSGQFLVMMPSYLCISWCLIVFTSTLQCMIGPGCNQTTFFSSPCVTHRRCPAWRLRCFVLPHIHLSDAHAMLISSLISRTLQSKSVICSCVLFRSKWWSHLEVVLEIRATIHSVNGTVRTQYIRPHDYTSNLGRCEGFAWMLHLRCIKLR